MAPGRSGMWGATDPPASAPAASRPRSDRASVGATRAARVTRAARATQAARAAALTAATLSAALLLGGCGPAGDPSASPIASQDPGGDGASQSSTSATSRSQSPTPTSSTSSTETNSQSSSPTSTRSRTATSSPTASPSTAGPAGTPSSGKPGKQPAGKPGDRAAPHRPTVLRPGARGPQVLALQQRLTQAGYWLGTPDGHYGDLTRQAVMALQKVHGLSRDGIYGPKTAALLRAADGSARRELRPRPRSTRDGVEVDLERQVLLVIDGGRVRWVLNASTGTRVPYTAPDGSRGSAITPTGDFTVAWRIDAWRTSNLGRLYRPAYFASGGIAVHGALSVPGYPASHGCVRVSVPAMDMLWRTDALPVGASVRVH